MPTRSPTKTLPALRRVDPLPRDRRRACEWHVGAAAAAGVGEAHLPLWADGVASVGPLCVDAASRGSGRRLRRRPPPAAARRARVWTPRCLRPRARADSTLWHTPSPRTLPAAVGWNTSAGGRGGVCGGGGSPVAVTRGCGAGGRGAPDGTLCPPDARGRRAAARAGGRWGGGAAVSQKGWRRHRRWRAPGGRLTSHVDMTLLPPRCRSAIDAPSEIPKCTVPSGSWGSKNRSGGVDGGGCRWVPFGAVAWGVAGSWETVGHGPVCPYETGGVVTHSLPPRL